MPATNQAKKSEWKKEHREHPSFTIAQAKQIAKDHAKKSKHKSSPKMVGPIQTANTDFTKMKNGYKTIATRRVIY